jgi:hypothetical protein
MSRLVSSKVKKTPPSQVSQDRYNFLQLSETEPDLGVPDQDGYILSSNSTGQRSWIEIDSLRSFLGFKYNFIGVIDEDEEPGNGNIGVYFSETNPYFHISKTSFNGENISPILPYMIKSTSIEKSIVILKDLQTTLNPKIFSMSVIGYQEFGDFYRFFFSSSSGLLFDEESKISFEFSISGDKGSAVTILGIYDDLNELQSAHPTGNPGDGYLVQSGDLYVWIDAPPSWINVGPVRGPQGPEGPPAAVIDGGTPSTIF